MDRLYALQSEALLAWRRAGRRGIVEAVTGSGKTRLAIETIREALDDGRAVMVIVPSKELQRQWFDRVREALGSSARVARLGSGHSGPLRLGRVLIAIVSTAPPERPVQLTP